MSIKVKGFFEDIGGASRVTEARRAAIRNASSVPDPRDHIREVADLLHPDPMPLRVTEIRETSPYSKTFRFESPDGHLPVFQSGQYASFRLRIGESELTRPYTISSAPFEARGERPFFEITVRRNRPYLVPDWLFENLHVGDTVEGALPFGTFYWEPLRDSRDITALAGGVGITPFYSMAKEIAFGKMKGCRLTILYGSVKTDDIVLRNELEAVEAACPDVKVVHVLSDEPDWKGERGFLTRELIERYSAPDCTYMFCGPYPMYTFIKKTMDGMGVTGRRFRHDAVNSPSDVTLLPGWPAGKELETHTITVRRGIREDVVEAKGSESVAVALERAAIRLDTHCRSGECGFCRSQLLSGEIFVSPVSDGRRLMDKEMGWFHPCTSWPLSDLVIKIPIM